MLSFSNIWTVAYYEMKTLFRSWFFRIFAIVAIAVLTFLDILFFTRAINFTPWMMRGIPASLPYFNLLLLNTAQAIIAIFLASDFLKRDRKLNTTEVIYMRSMTNGDYVIGKAKGIFIIFFALDLIILLIAAVINIVFADIPFHLMPYFYYLFIQSVPSLIFIIGLSFICMILFRNQAVTFVVLLGYVAVSLFFLKNRAGFLFDYMGYWLPLSYSDFIGFSNLSWILWQRAIYLFIGLGFVFLTVLTLNRLPQSRTMRSLSIVMSIILFAGAFYLAMAHIHFRANQSTDRQKMMQLNDSLFDAPDVSVLKSHISLEHSGDEIVVKNKLVYENRNKEPLEKLIFRLNPGLKVDRIQQRDKDVSFGRNLHILEIRPDKRLLPGAIDSLSIFYHGTIDETVCYLDVDDSTRNAMNNLWLYKTDKRHSFVSSDYVLLTPEALWYPVAGGASSTNLLKRKPKEFIRFELQVKAENNMLAISQGKCEKRGVYYRFSPEYPLTQISLVLGPYKKRSIQVDSVDYALYTFASHDYFVPFLSELQDTLKALIRDAKNEFEAQFNLTYPFKRLSLVEVPIQFVAYNRPLSLSPDVVQPEQVLLPENGVTIGAADFGFISHNFERRSRRRSSVTTKKEFSSRLFEQFLAQTVFNPDEPRSYRFNRSTSGISYCIFPEYYHFVNSLSSAKWPILEPALEAFLNSKIVSRLSRFIRFIRGLSNEEKANLELKKYSLAEMLADSKERRILNTVLKVKSDYLFKYIISQIGAHSFDEMLRQFLKENRFRMVDFEKFSDAIEQKFSFSIQPVLQPWLAEKRLPGFLLSNVRNFKVIEADRTRYQIIFQLQNPEPVDGLVSVTFRTRQGGRFFGPPQPAATEERIYHLSPQQTKEIGIVLDDEPRAMIVNTIMSRNLPLELEQRFENFEMAQNAIPFDGERVMNEPISPSSNEIVIDNESPDFRIQTKIKGSPLQKLLKIHKKSDEMEYIPFRPWRIPKTWKKTTLSQFYGKYIHSAYFIKSGHGEKKVAWRARISESGQYDVYAYFARIRLPMMRRRRPSDYLGQMHYIIHHDDGDDEVILEAKTAEDGWNLLGSFYFSQGTATVELTNETNKRMVIADAVKWVKR